MKMKVMTATRTATVAEEITVTMVEELATYLQKKVHQYFDSPSQQRRSIGAPSSEGMCLVDHVTKLSKNMSPIT